MPLRASASPVAPGTRLYRRFRFGDLVELNILDTRRHRSDQPCGDGLTNCAGRFDAARSMTGDDQEAWLLDGLRTSTSKWNVLAPQTLFAAADFNSVPGSKGPAGMFNVDQWDGYVVQRRRLTEFLASPEGPLNPVVITGDLHSSW